MTGSPETDPVTERGLRGAAAPVPSSAGHESPLEVLDAAMAATGASAYGPGRAAAVRLIHGFGHAAVLQLLRNAEHLRERHPREAQWYEREASRMAVEIALRIACAGRER